MLSIPEQNIVKFQIIVNESMRMYDLQQIQDMKHQIEYGNVRNIEWLWLQICVKIETESLRYKIPIQFVLSVVLVTFCNFLMLTIIHNVLLIWIRRTVFPIISHYKSTMTNDKRKLLHKFRDFILWFSDSITNSL